MEVFHVLGYLAKSYGGPPAVALALGKSMQKYGVTPSWWATATREEVQELAYLGEKAYLFPTSRPYSWYRSPDLHRSIAANMGRATLLHLHQVWDYPLLAAGRVAQQTDTPYLVTPHGIFTQRWRYSSLKKRIYLRFLARPLLNRAAAIHAVFPGEIEGMKQAGIKGPFTMIPNGIDPTEFENLPSSESANEHWPALRDRLVVLFLGRLSPEKGIDQLLQAWRQIIVKFPKALLVLAGPDYHGYRADVETMIERADLKRSVIMPGILRGREKLMMLSRADIFVQPSYSEGFSISILEALACNKPCLITTECNFNEVAAAEAGKVVAPTAENLSEALFELLSLSTAERTEMGHRGRSLVMHEYTWDIVAQKMLTVYRAMTTGKPIPTHPTPAN